MKKNIKAKEGLPEAFIQRMRDILAPDDFDEAIRSFSEPKRAAFRIQKPGINPQVLIRELSATGFSFQAVPWLPGAYLCRREDLRLLQSSARYLSGDIYIQGLSSMAAVLALDPQPDERILDLTAAPGSKTTLIALKMGGRGELVANEKNRGRFFRLKAIVDHQGFGNVRLTLMPGEIWGRKEPESFDRILLDAPCSSEGQFRANDPKTLGYWKIQKIREMVRMQKKLLVSAFAALKPGGRLLYSTCTFAPEENESVLDWALKRFGDCAQVEQIVCPLPKERLQPGLTCWDGNIYPAELKSALRILPNHDYDGFFMCSIKKTNSWHVTVAAQKDDSWKRKRRSR